MSATERVIILDPPDCRPNLGGHSGGRENPRQQEIPPDFICPHCQGRGGFTLRKRNGPNPFPCHACSATGVLASERAWQRYRDCEIHLYQTSCGVCHGNRCEICAGTGIVLLDSFGKPYYLGWPDEHPQLRALYREWERLVPGISVNGRQALPPWRP